MDTRRDLDLNHNMDKQFHAAQEVMTNQFLLVLLSLLFADLMTHSAIKPELRESFEGYRVLLSLQPSPLHTMCAGTFSVVESTNTAVRYPTLGPDSSSKETFPDKSVVSVVSCSLT